MAQVFVTESSTKPKPQGKAALRVALRGDDPEKLRDAITTFKASPQFKQSDLISDYYLMMNPL